MKPKSKCNRGWQSLTGGYLLAAVLFCAACAQEPPKVPRNLKDSDAIWIADGRTTPVHDSLFYLNQPAPLFRKEFQTASQIKSARLSITAAGYYQASINGELVGKNTLDPAWTDFSKRIYFTEYEVTHLLAEGANCLGVSLGNGFYNPLPLRKWGMRNLREDTKVGKPTFLAQLSIEYANGESMDIVSDTTWTYATGPLLRNSVYIGVTYNANQEIEGWNAPGFDDDLWERTQRAESPGGELQRAFIPPVQITREIAPIGIYPQGPGRWIVDMGENFTGTYRARLHGKRGDTINLRFGERIYDDGSLNPMTTVIGQIKQPGVGGPGAPDIAWQADAYIIGEDPDAWFQPPFTYHAYRYIEVEGLQQAPDRSDLVGLSMHSNVPNESSFSSSSALLNSIQKATERTFLANLVSVQSDCPAREKFGYGGDINATSEAFIYNFDMQAFYRKTVYDWLDAMNDTSFVDTAPYVGIQYCGISWESAYLITQYYLYLYYGDEDFVRELYDQNVQWMDKVARLHPNAWVDQGLSDHESLEPVPVELIGTAHYLQCARIMATFAEVLGDEARSDQYLRLADQISDRLRKAFWDQPVAGPINRQTLFATLLYHGVVPEDQKDAAKDSLLLAVQRGPAGHFSTGIFGTKYILEALSHHVSPQAVFDVVNSTNYPGWGHMIDRGATTLWETWKESDNIYSNNHPMFGSVSEWFYRWLGGIRPDPRNPGFEEFLLAPVTPSGLDSVTCTYSSPRGLIKSSWRREENGDYRFQITVPEGSVGHVHLPIDDLDRVEVTKYGLDTDESERMRLSTPDLQLEGGHHQIWVSRR
ncbi:MAG: family 78 glycoside hydrolase catalytic domain [Bacteroidota bacterium]